MVRGRCRGSVYIAVLGTSLIVSLLALSAIGMQRTQRRAYHGSFDVVEARQYAQAALRMALLRMESDPDWRYNLPNGAWSADVPIGTGSYSIEATDPSDNDLRDAANEPVVLTGTGKKGQAVQKVSITLSPESRPLSSLKSTLHADGTITFTSATVQNSGVISSNQTIAATASSIAGTVEAVGPISGSSYSGTRTTPADKRDMPDPAKVFDYYKARGTWLNLASIPLAANPVNLVLNPGGETGVPPWYGINTNCTISTTATGQRSGAAALSVTNRQNYKAAIAQDLAGRLVNGMSLSAEVWVKASTNPRRQIQLELSTTSGDSDLSLSPLTSTTVNTWSPIVGAATISWSGSLQEAELRIETETDDKADYNIDDVRLVEVGLSGHVIRQQVLSPASNPFGPATNPEGIYVIDCGGRDLHIERSRIVGTLVLLNPGPGSTVRAASLNWSPAVANFPVLLVEGNLALQARDEGLSETQNATNFNPLGTPYQGLGEDVDQSDTYPSEIVGLVYVSGNLSLSQRPVIKGVVCAGGQVTVTGRLNLSHQPVYVQNPPPGFIGKEEIRILLNSVTKVVD